MDPAVISALSGLVGVLIGGVTSFATSWFIQSAQLRAKQLELHRSKREALFGEFIAEASRLYADALSHKKDEVADMVKLYAIVSQMRLWASATVIAKAERVMDDIATTYLGPNRTLHEMRELAAKGGLDLLVAFSEACRDDLADLTWSSRHMMS